jgi:hypothetical protein
MEAPAEKKVTFAASPPPLPQWEMEASTPSVRVTENNLEDLSPFVPTDLGHFVWIKVRSTWKGVVCEATIYEYSEGFERRSDEANGRKLNPTSAVRLIQEVDGFENDALRHLSLKATHAALSGVSKSSAVAKSAGAAAGAAASTAASAGAPPTPIPVPAHIFNDQSLLQRLEDHIESAAFNAPLERFAAEHAHKFKPLGPNEEHPLHYQELYRLFEQVLETALEAILRASEDGLGLSLMAPSLHAGARDGARSLPARLGLLRDGARAGGRSCQGQRRPAALHRCAPRGKRVR